MALPEPKTWQDGELVTPQMMNTHVRDVQRRIFEPPFLLLSFAGDNIPIANASWVVVPFDTVAEDPADWYNLESPESVNVQESGLYGISGQVRFATNGSGIRGVSLEVNGLAVNQTFNTPPPSRNSVTFAYREIRLREGDEVTMRARQESGGSLSLRGIQPYYTFLSVRWLGR